MAKTFELCVKTPAGTFLRETVEYVDLPTHEGGYGVLAGHAETILFLNGGMVRYVTKGEQKRFFVLEGIAYATGKDVTVTTDFAESEETVEEALRRREEYYAEEKNRRKESYAAFKKSRIDLNRAMRNLTSKPTTPNL